MALWTRWTTAAVLAAAMLLGACGDSVSSGGTGAGGAGGSGGKGGKGGSGGKTGSGASAGDGQGGDGQGGDGASGSGGGVQLGGTGSGGGSTCGGITQKAELAPLDMYVMMDQSGSMADTTADGTAKWDAVTKAMKAFLENPQSKGLGVGIQYFPLATPGVPFSCSADADCKGHGPCEKPLARACTNVQQIEEFCADDSDCTKHGAGSTCEVLGLCSKDSQAACFPDQSASCGAQGTCQPLALGVCEKDQSLICLVATGPCVDDKGNNFGACQPIPPSCAGYESCVVADYAKPEVEIAALPGAVTALEKSLNAHGPTTGTPTAPALKGAIDHAKTWAQGHADHKVIAVLATDGLPTSCDPTNIDQVAAIASQGATGSPALLSFVIGVFGPSDIDQGAPQNLDKIAKAGGTDKAYLVDTNADVTQQFLQALNEIRGKVLTCEYKIPASSEGTTQYDKVNVEFTSGAGTTTTVPYVGSSAKCDPQKGGWYYDVDPKSGKTPTTIRICPQTCKTFQSDAAGQVDVRLGCDTVIIN